MQEGDRGAADSGEPSHHTAGIRPAVQKVRGHVSDDVLSGCQIKVLYSYAVHDIKG